MKLIPLITLCLTFSVFAEDKTITVSADGQGDFKTVQEAINSVTDKNTSRVVIQIHPGIYKERIEVPKTKPFITFKGEDAEKTILTWDWSARHVGPDGKEVGTGGSCSTRILGHDFTAESITFENTAGDTGQALAMFANADRMIFRNCRFLGWQDTLYANGGRHYYQHCYLEGRVDFIFGNATAVFDHCTVKSKNGGYVTAASTAQDKPFGYVFLDSNLISDGKPALLGRPWQPYAAVAFIRCEIQKHIKPEGWDNWRKPENEKTARYSEYQCTGEGADRTKRVAWSKELTAEEAANYTIDNILSGDDQWKPQGL